MERLGNPRSVRIFDTVTDPDAPKWVFQRTDRAFPIAERSLFVLVRATEIDLDLDPTACPELDKLVSALLESLSLSPPSITSLTGASATLASTASATLASTSAMTATSSSKTPQWPPTLFAEAVRGMDSLQNALGKSGNQSFESEFYRQYPGYHFVSSTVHRTVKFYLNNKHLIPLFSGATWSEFRAFASSADHVSSQGMNFHLISCYHLPECVTQRSPTSFTLVAVSPHRRISPSPISMKTVPHPSNFSRR